MGVHLTEKLPTLLGQRVILRQATREDVPGLFRVFSDPAVVRYWSRPAMNGLDEAVRYFEEIERAQSSGLLFQWSLADARDNQLIGTCTLFHFDWRNRRAEIGYALASHLWQRGLMREGLTLLLDFVFDELSLHRLEADVDPRNQASLALLSRLGFQKEGLLRERWLLEGEKLDACFLGLLVHEWRACRPLKRQIDTFNRQTEGA